MAVLAGAVESVRAQLLAGADPDAADTRGRSALMLAASRGHHEVGLVLLEAGANPAMKDSAGNDAIAIARSRKDVAMEELLHRGRFAAGEHPGGNEEIVQNPSDEQPLNGRRPELPGIPPETRRRPALIRGEVATNQGDSEACAVDHEESREPSRDQDEVLDLSGWEEEVETQPPPDDPSLADEAAALQVAFSRHSPVDTDEDWDDVDIDLPELAHLDRRHSHLGIESSNEIRALIVRALENGRVECDQIEGLVGEALDLDDARREALESNLRLVLGDLGVVIDDEPVAARQAPEITDEEEDRFGDLATEAMELLGRLLSSDVDPAGPYARSVPADLLTRDDEAALGHEIEEGTREALETLAKSPMAVARVVGDAQGVLDGTTKASDLFDHASAPDDADDSSPTAIPAGRGEEGEVEIAPGRETLASNLKRIVELCRESEPDPGELGRRMLEARFSASYHDELRRIAETDAAWKDARERFQSGLERVARAKQRFVERNLKLVIWVARKHRRMPILDTIQAGNIGLMRAVDKFDHRRGTKFSTYAVWWIRQAIFRAADDSARIIRLPVHVMDSLRKMERAEVLAHAKYGERCDVDRIAALADLSADRVRKLREFPEDPLSMHVPAVAKEVIAVADERAVPFEEDVLYGERRKLVREQLDTLTDREASIIRRRFGIDCSEHTLEAVGKEFGVTRERVRQIESKALRKLRHPSRSSRLRDALPR